MGKVKSVEIFTGVIGEAELKLLHGLRTSTAKQIFNLNGLLTEEEELIQEDQKFSKDLYYYNNFNKLVVNLNYTSNNQLDKMRRFSYNNLGQLIKYEFFGRDTTYPLSREYYLYENEKLTRIIDSSFGQCTSTLFLYDDKNNLIEKRRYDSEGKIDFTNFYKYDEKGNLVWHHLLSADFRTDQIRTYSFDKNNNLVERTLIEEDEIMHYRWVNEYNAEGKKIRAAQYEYDKLTDESLFIYNNKGELAGEEEYDGDNNLYKTISYENDETGNWIKKTTRFHDGTVKIESRSFVYN